MSRPKRLSRRAAATYADAESVSEAGPSHTISLTNCCNSGTPIFRDGTTAEDLLNGTLSYTNATIKGMVYLPYEKCEDDGTNCAFIDIEMNRSDRGSIAFVELESQSGPFTPFEFKFTGACRSNGQIHCLDRRCGMRGGWTEADLNLYCGQQEDGSDLVDLSITYCPELCFQDKQEVKAKLKSLPFEMSQNLATMTGLVVVGTAAVMSFILVLIFQHLCYVHRPRK